ncbi:hypothetical protein DFH06DRAFT_4863 [Mycena polygramma]|nr:hypothetical protein DFH06DRAFT_4863 [Mycena polygramma]
MSEHSLPDEIISEILSPALKISDEQFSDTSGVSPFATYSESTSAYLLVCKAWLRVATPLLYHVVVLRSKAQAKALSIAVSKNTLLGGFIRKLRVEGGYGGPMGVILKCAPNISDLYVTFQLWSSDNADGLVKGLPLINPTRLILQDLHDSRRVSNKVALAFEQTLVKTIPKWDRLTIVDFPYTDWGRTNRVRLIVEALVQSKRLRDVTIKATHVQDIPWIYEAFRTCPLQAIHMKEHLRPSLYSQVEINPKLKALVKLPPDPLLDSIVVPQLVAAFGNGPLMKAAPQVVQEGIWKRVLYFAMSVPELTEQPDERIPGRLPLLLVSKTFNRLALPYYYTRVALESSFATFRFVAVLKHYPSLASEVRTISGQLTEYQFNYDTSDLEDEPLAAEHFSQYRPTESSDAALTLALFSQTSKLRRVLCSVDLDYGNTFHMYHAPSLHWEAFEQMAKCCGATLEEFSAIVAGKSDAPPTVFDNLSALRTLDWRSNISFACDPAHTSPESLSNLTELKLGVLHPSFFTVLTLMTLSSLRRLLVHSFSSEAEPFLQEHGSKLIELDVTCEVLSDLHINIFELCPNLNLISIRPRSRSFKNSLDIDANHFSSDKTAHCSLTKVRIQLTGYWNGLKEDIALFDTFFSAFEDKCLPNLREIEFGSCQWPTTEREISKSCWVRWAELLLESGIDLTDKSGKKWRPRLKAQQVGRR